MAERGGYIHPYSEGVRQLGTWTDLRQSTGRAIGKAWRGKPVGSSASLIDFGSGDGELAELVVNTMGTSVSEYWAVEPDLQLRRDAVARFNAQGLRSAGAATLQDLPKSVRWSFFLASHVLYFVGDLDRWVNSVNDLRLPHEARIAVVIRSDRCDSHLWRSIVRVGEGSRARLSTEVVSSLLASVGFDIEFVCGRGTYSAPSADVPALLEAFRRGDPDPSGLAYVLRWLGRLDPAAPVHEPVVSSLEAFLRSRTKGDSVVLQLEDSVILGRSHGR